MEKDRIYITFKELGLVMCKADTKRKIIKPIYDKMHLESISVFYRMGYIFRSQADSKKYYTIEEIREMIKSYIEKTN